MVSLTRVAASVFIASFCGVAAANEPSASTHFDQTGNYEGEYLCVGTAAGGVKLNELTGRWEASTFNVDGERVVVRVKALGPAVRQLRIGSSETAMGYSVEIAESGKRALPCKNSSTPPEDPMWIGASGMFMCNVLSEYRFNLSKLKFKTYGIFGYTDGSNDTPYVMIGECSRF